MLYRLAPSTAIHETVMLVLVVAVSVTLVPLPGSNKQEYVKTIAISGEEKVI